MHKFLNACKCMRKRYHHYAKRSTTKRAIVRGLLVRVIKQHSYAY